MGYLSLSIEIYSGVIYLYDKNICDAVRQNESEVSQKKILVFYIVVLGIFNATFDRKPDENWLVNSIDTSSWFC